MHLHTNYRSSVSDRPPVKALPVPTGDVDGAQTFCKRTTYGRDHTPYPEINAVGWPYFPDCVQV